jgi:enamidase
MKGACPALALAAVAVVVVSAQPPQQFNNLVRSFVKVDAPVLALTHVRVIDGTGAPAREDQTIVVRNGSITDVGDAARVTAPEGATVLDLTGKSVMPGIVMVHEHTYYPTGPGQNNGLTVYANLGESFVRLYLAGGVTTMRTAGNTNGVMFM